MRHYPAFKKASFLLIIMICTGCAANISPTPSIVTSLPSETYTRSPTSSPSFTPTVKNTYTRRPTLTPSITPTITITPLLFGTPLYEGAVINENNIDRLAKVGEWGKGSIQSVAFSPDGNFMVIGGAFGLAIYEMDNLSSPPSWLPFGSPFEYENMFFSPDGKYILLQGYETSQIRDFETGMVVKPKETINWVRPTGKTDFTDLEVRSGDGSKIFHSSLDYGYVEELFTEETLVREVIDPVGKPLYQFTDKIPYIEYDDRVQPEGCDLTVFSPCGNALMAVTMAPKKAEFSPDGKTLTVLYNVPSLFGSDFTNILRVYDADNGRFLMGAGGSETPVKDFAYSPDSRLLVTGHLDGSVRLWNIADRNSIFGARHMSSEYLDAISFTDDSEFLLVQRGDELEIRRAKDGELVSRSEISVFSLSPANSNLIAVADLKNNVHIREIDSGNNILTLENAHDDLIYTLSFSPDGRYLVTSGRDCDIKLWDLESKKVLHHFEERSIDPYEIDWSSRPFMYSMQFIPQTDLILGFGSWGTAAVWDVNSGALKYFLQSPPLDFYDGMITVKPHFPEYFRVDLAENRFYIDDTGFNLDTGERTSEQPQDEIAVKNCSSSGARTPDGTLMITRGFENYEGQLCVLNADDLTLVSTIPVLDDTKDGYYVGWPFISPDGKQLIVTTDSGILFIYQILPQTD
jgi:WD40 repeat protein